MTDEVPLGKFLAIISDSSKNSIQASRTLYQPTEGIQATLPAHQLLRPIRPTNLDKLYSLLETPTFWELQREGYIIPVSKFQLKEVPGPRRKFKVTRSKERGTTKGVRQLLTAGHFGSFGCKRYDSPSKLYISADRH
jgi:hypothetical protein